MGSQGQQKKHWGCLLPLLPHIPWLIQRQGTRVAAASRGRVRGRLWQAPRHLQHKVPGAGGTSQAGRQPCPAAATPGAPSGPSCSGGKARGGTAPRALPAGARPGRRRHTRPSPWSPDRFPAAPHLVTLHS